MSNKLFTPNEIEVLSKNPYVKKVSTKGITYTEEFKRIFIVENEKGVFPRDIFTTCGFDIEILGMKRIESSGKRWRASYRTNGLGGLVDTRGSSVARTEESNMTIEEKYNRLLIEKQLLLAENELLKKIKRMERGLEINL